MEDSEEDSSEEEEIICKELKNLFKKLRKRRVKKDSHQLPRPHRLIIMEWSYLSRGSDTEQNKGFVFPPVHIVALVMEVPDIGQ